MAVATSARVVARCRAAAAASSTGDAILDLLPRRVAQPRAASRRTRGCAPAARTPSAASSAPFCARAAAPWRLRAAAAVPTAELAAGRLARGRAGALRAKRARRRIRRRRRHAPRRCRALLAVLRSSLSVTVRSPSRLPPSAAGMRSASAPSSAPRRDVGSPSVRRTLHRRARRPARAAPAPWAA